MGDTLEVLRARKMAREQAKAAEAEAREIQELTLEEEWTEKLGTRGVEFEIVNTDIGLFVVKKPEFVVAKQFNALEKKSDEDVVRFVSPCVVSPAAADFRAVIIGHGGIAWRCALALVEMYEAKAVARGGKY